MCVAHFETTHRLILIPRVNFSKGQGIHDSSAANPTGQVFHDSSAANPTGQGLNDSSAGSPTGRAFHDSSAASPTGQVFHDSSAANPTGQVFHDSQAGDFSLWSPLSAAGIWGPLVDSINCPMILLTSPGHDDRRGDFWNLSCN